MTRRAIATTLGFVLVAPAPVAAGTIYGMIQESGKPLPAVGVILLCDGIRESKQTDARGTYRFTVPRSGRCRLDVQGGSAPVILYDEPTRYDFEIRREAGKPNLIRR